jgi:EmrB/QacA subfamily drug resistance transporter
MSTPEGTGAVSLRRPDRVLVYTLTLGAVLPLLDTTLLTIALQSIGQSLGAPLSQLQWIITGYTLAAAASVPLSTWLCQRIGAKAVWLAALWLFLAGACLCALAWTAEVLIFSRVMQGIATGLMLPTMQTIVVVALGPGKTREALSLMSVPAVLVPILGPLVGGAALLLFDWRMVFWAHVPIGLLAIRVADRVIPDIRERSHTPFDAVGFALLCPALVGCIHSLSTLANASTSSLISGMASLAGMLAFLVHAWRRADNSIVDVRLYRFAPFRRACFLLLLSSSAYYGGIFLYPLSLTQGGHHGLDMAGLLLALHGVGMLVARWLLPQAARRWGDRPIALACVLLSVVGSVLLLPAFTDDVVMMAVGMALRGAGIGVLTVLAMASAYTDQGPSQVAHASSLTRMVTLLGAAIGTTLVAMLWASAGDDATGRTASHNSAHLVLTLALALCGAACPVRPRVAG